MVLSFGGNGISPNERAWPVIDTDIHPLPDLDRVPEFMSQPWKRRFQEGNQGPGGFGFWNPHGLRRPFVDRFFDLQGAPGITQLTTGDTNDLSPTIEAKKQRVTTTVWYAKPSPTFSDALAAVRRTIWREQAFVTSRRRSHSTKVRKALPDAWAYALCYAA